MRVADRRVSYLFGVTPEIVRLIDANLNRAAEALRVMEDLARFVTGEAGLSGETKRLRHRVRGLLTAAGIDPTRAMACRDTPGDVGTEIKTESEGVRASARSIALAAGARACEALRVIEEALKLSTAGSGRSDATDPSTVWRTAEQIRYSVYDLASRLVLNLPGSRPAPQWRLCVLISPMDCAIEWHDTARRSIEGGADCLQLRAKDLSDSDLLRAAETLRLITRDEGVALIVNDRPDVALLCGADGVHVGQSDLSVEQVRRLAGESLIVGASTHNMGEALAAVKSGADVCGVGAMFASATKERSPSGLTYLRNYLADDRTARVPHLAIGGITPDNIGELIEAGCRGVAVSSAVCRSEQPERVCRSLRRSLDAAAIDSPTLASTTTSRSSAGT